MRSPEGRDQSIMHNKAWCGEAKWLGERKLWDILTETNQSISLCNIPNCWDYPSRSDYATQAEGGLLDASDVSTGEVLGGRQVAWGTGEAQIEHYY